jgi:Tol biopolymer transport system component
MNFKKLCCFALAAATLALTAPAVVAAKVASPLSSVVSALKADKNVRQYAVSHGGQKIAVVKKNSGGEYDLYIMTAANKKLDKVAKVSGMLYDPQWSYDDKYLSVEDGTGALKETDIVTVSALKKRWGVQNTGMVWAQKSESVAFSVVNPAVKQAVETELDGATDVIVYNMDTIKYKRIIKADARYDYRPLKWDGSGLVIQQASLVGGKTETLKYKI